MQAFYPVNNTFIPLAYFFCKENISPSINNLAQVTAFPSQKPDAAAQANADNPSLFSPCTQVAAINRPIRNLDPDSRRT